MSWAHFLQQSRKKPSFPGLRMVTFGGPAPAAASPRLLAPAGRHPYKLFHC
jgi:hypothetical protein